MYLIAFNSQIISNLNFNERLQHYIQDTIHLPEEPKRNTPAEERHTTPTPR
jgi:hypothetical protein